MTKQEQQTQQTTEPPSDPFFDVTPLQLVMASNLLYQQENTRLVYEDKAKDWQIKGLSKFADKIDQIYTQRQSAFRKAVGFLEGAFSSGWSWGGKWIRYLAFALIGVGILAYLNASSPQVAALGQQLFSGANLYWTTALFAFVFLISLFLIVRIRRRRQAT